MFSRFFLRLRMWVQHLSESTQSFPDRQRHAVFQITRMCLWILLFVVSPGTQLWAKSDSSVPTRHFSLIRNWQVEDGLPQNTILRILQSQDGYVWFVTFGGLVRFDGVTFTTFNTENTPGFLSNRLIALYESHDKSLWISTELGGLMQ
ncbi:MAG TPA: two-component regulator propeller domain-containing protein, partial [Acidobacteriota bacterium]|nr:two-component regulator propeller domain-containing protein [Acidobacteriota bacterium]HNG92245.1 two-component regulator propeller domain-containing protein [Acidobacteriota bacterium]